MIKNLYKIKQELNSSFQSVNSIQKSFKFTSKMRAEIIVSVLIFLTSVCGIYSQLSCVYYDKQYYGYACNLTINNPSGLDNFKRISGRHLSGKANKDVNYITSNSASNTTTIPSFICKTFKNLTDIELRSMGIQYIGENSFKNCQELLKLDLYGNRISKIDEKAFENNQQLSTLYLYQNRLSELPEKVFLNQQNLLTLWLDGNTFTSFPKIALAPLIKLNNLDFQGNQVKNLTVESFKGLENLKNINLGSNQIEDLPRNVFSNLINLTSITLSYNKLKIIHSFGNLPNLTQIYLSYNKIEAIDRKIIDNTGVTNLNMAGNVCANFAITANSGSRELLTSGLRNCFEKYNEVFSNGE